MRQLLYALEQQKAQSSLPLTLSFNQHLCGLDNLIKITFR